MNNKDGQKGQGFFSTFRSPETSRRVPFIDQFETIKCISPEPTIKMKSIIQAFRIKDWGASIDLKDTYLTVPINAEEKCLRFCIDNNLNIIK